METGKRDCVVTDGGKGELSGWSTGAAIESFSFRGTGWGGMYLHSYFLFTCGETRGLDRRSICPKSPMLQL
jgi:hypothetical protein